MAGQPAQSAAVARAGQRAVLPADAAFRRRPAGPSCAAAAARLRVGMEGSFLAPAATHAMFRAEPASSCLAAALSVVEVAAASVAAATERVAATISKAASAQAPAESRTPGGPSAAWPA